MNERDLGSLTANISSTDTETRVSDGRLTQANGGGAQFTLLVPRTGQDNISIDATLDRMNAGNVIAALPVKNWREQLADTEADVSGNLKINRVAHQKTRGGGLGFWPGRLFGEAFRGLYAPANFSGPAVKDET